VLQLVGGSLIILRKFRLQLALDLCDFRIALDLRVFLGIERIREPVAYFRLQFAIVFLVEFRRCNLPFRFTRSGR